MKKCSTAIGRGNSHKERNPPAGDRGRSRNYQSPPGQGKVKIQVCYHGTVIYSRRRERHDYGLAGMSANNLHRSGTGDFLTSGGRIRTAIKLATDSRSLEGRTIRSVLKSKSRPAANSDKRRN